MKTNLNKIFYLEQRWNKRKNAVFGQKMFIAGYKIKSMSIYNSTYLLDLL